MKMPEEIPSLREKPWVVYPTFFYSTLQSGPLSIGRRVSSQCEGMIYFRTSDDEELLSSGKPEEVLLFETSNQAIDYIVKNTAKPEPFLIREDLEIQLLRDFPVLAQSRPKLSDISDIIEQRCCPHN